MTLNNDSEATNMLATILLDNPNIADHSYWWQVHQQLVNQPEVIHNIVANAMQSAHDTALDEDNYEQLQ